MYKICSLFAGVGGIDLGFLQTNKCDVVYANEFDEYAVKTYEKNFNEVWQEIPHPLSCKA